MINYAKQLPRDKNGEVMEGFPPAFPAIQTVVGVPAASSVITLSDSATMIEISTIGAAAALIHWGTTSIISSSASASFDNAIPGNSTRRFVIPQQTVGAGDTSVMGANSANGLYSKVAVMVLHASNTSVMTTAY
jgi:hypothetical protein